MRYIDEYDGLRGLMALWVVLGHWSTTTLIAIPGIQANLSNSYAVDVFIILSGFAIASLLEGKQERYRVYILRRALRIFPAYWFYLLLSVFIVMLLPDVWSSSIGGAMKEVRAEILSLSLINFEPNIFTHILAIQGLIPTQFLPQGEYAFLGQAWSISLEWQFYIIAPFITLFIMQYWKSLIALSVLLFVLIVIKVTSTIMPNGFIGNHALLFFLGAATHYLFLLHIRHNTSIHDANKKMLLLVIFLILIETPNVIPILIWIVVNAGIINSTGLKKTLISSILTHKVCKWLGIRSYSIYLSHMIPLTICVAVMTSFEIHNPIVHASMLLFTTLIGTIAFSYSTYRWIEAPFQKLGKKLTSQRR